MSKKTRSAHFAHERKQLDKKEILLKQVKRETEKYYTNTSSWIAADIDDDGQMPLVLKSLREMKKLYKKLDACDRKIKYHRDRQVK